MKLTLLAALAALSLSAQTVAPSSVAAKPATPAGVPSPAVAPQLPTSKIWRLVVVAQNAHKAADESELGKASKAADAEVQAEQQRLSAVCVGAGFVLGMQNDQKAENAGDVVCVARPKDPAPVEAKKDK